MTVQFSKIPGNLRLPGVFIETDSSKASRLDDPGRILLIGQMLATGTAAAGVPVPVVSVADAKAQFGIGSMLADMMDAVRQVDPFGLVWALPLADAGGGVAATGTLTVTAAPTAPGTIPLYIAGISVPVAVAGSETIAQTAAAIAAAITANPNLPVTAAAGGAGNAVVTLTANHKGLLGNDIDVRYALLGAAGGEALPTSYAGAIVAMGGVIAGTTNPTITTALAALGDTTFDYLVMPYVDTTNMAAASAAMNDTTGRWAYNRMIWGHVFTVMRGTSSALTTFGLTRNDPHITVLGFNLSPTPAWRWVAAQVAASAVPLRNDPARPVQGIGVPGIVAPPLGTTGRFAMSERQTLLWSGISTFTVGPDNTVQIERLISTYQLDGNGQPSAAWLSVEKIYTLMLVHRRLRAAVSANFPRAKLAADGTRSASANGVLTPSIARAFIIAEMRSMEDDGILQNVDAVRDQVNCEINGQNPDRLDVLFPPPLMGQARIFAILSQFRLQV